MEKTKIRLDVLNISFDSWAKVKNIAIDDSYIEVTPQGLIELIGISGGNFLSFKLNAEEKLFVDEYHALSRSMIDKTNPS